MAAAAPPVAFIASVPTTDTVSAAAPLTKPVLRSGRRSPNYIPPEIINETHPRAASCFRRCYEQGLSENPSLQGRVVVHFVVDRDGWVPHGEGSRKRARRCSGGSVRRARVRRAPLPKPEGDRISVVYPLVFAPGDGERGAGTERWCSGRVRRPTPGRALSSSTPARRRGQCSGAAPRQGILLALGNSALR